jgi:signal transduction histidine kinase
MSGEHLGLFDTPPDRNEVRFSLTVVGLLVAAVLLILPVRDVPTRPIDAFIPVTDAVMFVGELITATLLYAQAAVFRSRALTVLGSCYVYTALLLVAHALTFPGAFAPDGLLGAGINTSAYLATLRRGAFPIAVLLYVLIRGADSTARPATERPSAGIVMGVFLAIALAAGVILLTTVGHDLLPAYFNNRADVIYNSAIHYEAVICAIIGVATAVLFVKRRSMLDWWLLLVLSGWLIQSLLILALKARFTVGWYGLYGVMLFSHLVVLLALIAEHGRLYVRLALSTSARDREREARLMSLDALAAAISHEAGQPLSAVGAHARAGLNRLTREQPDVAKAIYSLQAVIDAGHRASDVIKSIRAMFGKRPGVVTEFSLNDLVRATASLLVRELAGGKVSLQFALEAALPSIRADRVQMQRVLVNLITNAIESLGTVRGRPRCILIRSASVDEHTVALEISDNGPGIAPQALEEVFEPFFTTKAAGAGLGLWLCRAMVESHGGHLWATPGEVEGVTFHLQMPNCAPAVARWGFHGAATAPETVDHPTA